MIIGEHAHPSDLNVNCCREKKLTNIRAAGRDENVILTPPREMGLEKALEWIADDELVEVTPKSVRMRKKALAVGRALPRRARPQARGARRRVRRSSASGKLPRPPPRTRVAAPSLFAASSFGGVDHGGVERGQPRGLLYPRPDARHFDHARVLPSEDLRPWVEHFWAVRWDLRAQPPYLQQNLSHPSIHWSFERGTSRIDGVPHGRFSMLLEGLGGVFAIKFRPGGFFPFVGTPVAALSRAHGGRGGAAGPGGARAGGRPSSPPTSRATRTRSASPWRRPSCARAQPAAGPERGAGAGARHAHPGGPRGAKVEDLLTPGGPGLRTLQRLFSRYVGVSPKWVIQRYRLHEAAERLREVTATGAGDAGAGAGLLRPGALHPRLPARRGLSRPPSTPGARPAPFPRPGAARSGASERVLHAREHGEGRDVGPDDVARQQVRAHGEVVHGRRVLHARRPRPRWAR